MAKSKKPRSADSTRSTLPPWKEARGFDRAPLDQDLETEVCVIGAGFAGLSAAYYLSKEGAKVVVLDSGPLAGGESAATTAHHSTALDERWLELEKKHGAAACRLAASSHAWAIDAIERVCAEEGIDCDFSRLDGWLVLAPEDGPELLDEELAAARRCGLDVEKVARPPLPGFKGPALLFPRQGQCEPSRFLAGLAAAAERRGARIYGGTEAVEVADGQPALVTTRDGRTISAKKIVVATNVPFNDRVALQTRLFPYRSYAIAARLPVGTSLDSLVWDTAESYHYVRRHGDLLIVGGEDHKTGQADDQVDRLERLADWARARFRGLGPVEHGWSGQIIETADGLAFIGLNPGNDHVYVITGESGNGTTYGVLGGRLVCDLVQGRENDWAGVYSPRRTSAKGAKEWLKENLNVAAQYKDYLTPGEVSSVEEIAPGSGAVVRRGLRKVAVHRAEDGSMTELSAVCPHLGGIVCWNPGEKSWDCPLHGSRFNAAGEVLNGPARSGLPPAEPSADTPPPPRPDAPSKWTGA